jgi:hypothetical protein
VDSNLIAITFQLFRGAFSQPKFTYIFPTYPAPFQKPSGVKRDPLLPGHEGEALTQFQQKRLKVVDQSLLQMGFYKLW